MDLFNKPYEPENQFILRLPVVSFIKTNIDSNCNYCLTSLKCTEVVLSHIFYDVGRA